METNKDRQKKIMLVSKRLLIFAGISLGLTIIVFIPTFFYNYHFFISWLCFECGIIGGFVSIQQRLKKIGNDELTLLSESWASILLVPVYGGIFALILYITFLSGLIKGDLFPIFDVHVFNSPVSTADIKRLLTETYPKNGEDFAKFIFWSFVAGFSERFVPQIIKNVAKPSSENDK
jgi:hypothetical protein